MRAGDVSQALQFLLPTRRPVFLHGPPGVGKSSIAQQAALALEVEFLDVRLAYHDPGDMKFPIVDVASKSIAWVNSLFPRDPGWRGVICFEELAQCPPLMQAAAMQITLDRRCGDYRLPESAYVMACSNRQEDRAGTHRIITPLLNRFIHLDLEVSNDDWQAWAIEANIAPEVRSFLRYRPALLFQFDAASGARAFCTPRSWSFVSDVLPTTTSHLMHPVVAGCVGEGPAAEFVGFVRIWRDLPDIDQVLASPGTIQVPRDPAVLYALSGALVEKVRAKGTPMSLVGKFIQFVKRMPAEFGVLTMRDAAAANRECLKAPGFSDWLKQNKDLLL